LIRRVSRVDADVDPHAVWNAFVDLLACSTYEELNAVQRVPHLAFCYESEVQNGGHLQFFENHPPEIVGPTIAALRVLDTESFIPILVEAVYRWRSQEREKLETVEDFVSAGLTREFEDLDLAYYDVQPTMIQLLTNYLNLKQDDFVVLEP
jgi:hypothetical protein